MQDGAAPEVQYDDPQVAEFEKQRAGDFSELRAYMNSHLLA